MPTKENLDREYQYCLERLMVLEPAYLQLRNSLTADQQSLLDSYIALCEALTEADCQLHLLYPNE